LLELCRNTPPCPIAERVRQRATALGRRHRLDAQAIIHERDQLIQKIYLQDLPPGWVGAWSDASSQSVQAGYHSSVGGFVLNTHGNVLVEFSQNVASLPPFEAEIAAVATVLKLAQELTLEKVRIHTDCKALVQRWVRQRDDPRLVPIRKHAHRLDGCFLKYIPRKHNTRANHLARLALLS
jgi:ribonuclease HI